MTIFEQEAYDEGYQAFMNGEDEASCPYETGYQDALGEYWLDGFDDARCDVSETVNRSGDLARNNK